MRTRRWPRFFQNRTTESVSDTYGQLVPAGCGRIRIGECVCPIPCIGYLCEGCTQNRPWCCGATDDLRCDYCMAKEDAA